MVEILPNDRLRDLLTKSSQAANAMSIRQDREHGFTYVQEAQRTPVRSAAELLRLVQDGSAQRSVAATHLNANSSRTHAVVQLLLKQEVTTPGSNIPNKLTSVMNLVDLAGSERAKRAGTLEDTPDARARLQVSQWFRLLIGGKAWR